MEMNLLATQIVVSALRYLFKSTFHSPHENSPPLQLLSFYLSQFHLIEGGVEVCRTHLLLTQHKLKKSDEAEFITFRG